MAANDPIDPRVRLAISRWPDDAPRGAVSTFCPEHGISRTSFYELRRRARVEGPAAVLEPRTRRPRTSPAKLSEEIKQPPPPPVRHDLPADTRIRKLTTSSTFRLNSVTCMVDSHRAFHRVLVITDGDHLTVTDTHGEILVEHTRPAPGITYVGNGRPRGPRPNPGQPSPKS